MKGPKNPERSFGVSVGGVLCLIALFFAWRGRLTRAEIAGGLGALLVIFGLVAPRMLKWPSDLWWRVARALGYVNARILLTVLFAIALVPLSLIWRVLGIDPLARQRDKWAGWSAYPDRYRDPKHYSRMY